MSEDKAFSSVDFVFQCLVDSKRTTAFVDAINKVVTKESVVIDLGTGSGIMAIAAAKAGAKQVYCVEYDPFIASIAKKNIEVNGLKNKIKMIVNDAKKISLKEKFDIVISEMLTTGIVDEHQVQAINNLHRHKNIHKSTIFIPGVQETYITPVDTSFEVCGHTFPMVNHLWKWLEYNPIKSKMAKKELLNKIDFSHPYKEQCDVVVEFKVVKKGKINSILLESKSILGTKTVEDTKALNAPVIIPLVERSVQKNDVVRIHVKYKFGTGYKNFKAYFEK